MAIIQFLSAVWSSNERDLIVSFYHIVQERHSHLIQLLRYAKPFHQITCSASLSPANFSAAQESSLTGVFSMMKTTAPLKCSNAIDVLLFIAALIGFCKLSGRQKSFYACVCCQFYH